MGNIVSRYAGLLQIAVLAAVAAAVTPAAMAGNILLGYEQDNMTYGYCTQAGPCITTPGVNGNNQTASLSGNAIPATGYDCCAIWSVHFLGTGSAQFDVSLSTSTSGEFSALSFDIFNNDCQTGGPVIPGCQSVQWQVSEAVNGGAYSDLGVANSGLPGLFNNSPFALNQSYNSGDTFAFRIQNLNQPGIATGQFVFYNVDLTAPDAPEPSTWMRLGTGLMGFAGIAYCRRRAL